MMNYVNAFFGWLWRKKFFFAVVLASALVFAVLIFPYSDLSDALTSQVAKSTGNQVYVQMESLNLSVLPAPAVAAQGVSADLLTFPALTIDSLKIRPAWISMLFSPLKLVQAIRNDMEAQMYVGVMALAHVRAEGLLGGDLSLDLSPDKVQGGAVTSQADIEIEQLDLAKAQEWAALPVKLQGRATAEASVKINAAMQEQPEGTFSVKVAKFALPAGPVMTQMGPINLPALSMANVVFRGRLSNGNLILDEGTFGRAGEPAYGRIKGQLGIRLQSMGGQIVPQFGRYDLTVDLNLTHAFEKELGFAFLLASFKTPTSTGNRYLMNLKGADFYGPPNATQVGSF